MKILVINGPNLNMLGRRNHKHYGSFTLDQINTKLEKLAKPRDVKLVFFQSNHEGQLIDFIQKESSASSGILINPGALTHYGYSLRDALEDTNLPIIEVHLSDISKREDFRKIDVIKKISLAVVIGQKENSYILGLKKLIIYIQESTLSEVRGRAKLTR
ncbi:3-dehydroquinate dehydratase [Candidatus Gottesmanbacteria bacterium]|nr:3-dehydroquinate dehydratase [Candidatus Gottesmanbacteria bacterium]